MARSATKKESPVGERLVRWVGSSKGDISNLPHQVKQSFGVRLFELQQGKTPLGMGPLPEFGSGVYELRDDFDTDTYRAIYVLNLKDAIYVLHAFKKKAKSGKAMPKSDKELIANRLKRARELDSKGA